MDYQILNSNFKLNINKNIGKVLYIVEGEKREINLIAKVFLNILKYKEVVSINRKGKRKYRTFSKEDNPNSKIVIINSETSNINSITNQEFIDNQIKLLRKYGLDYDFRNSAIYYIFDADRKEDINSIKNLIKSYTNSREPNKNNKFDEIGGMLLLNYPSIESFIISNFEKDVYLFNKKFNLNTKELKEYINKKGYNDSNLTEETVTNSFYETIKSLNYINIDKINLDNIEEFNNKVMAFEENNNMKYILSLLLISFLDLGIIEIE